MDAGIMEFLYEFKRMVDNQGNEMNKTLKEFKEIMEKNYENTEIIFDFPDDNIPDEEIDSIRQKMISESQTTVALSESDALRIEKYKNDKLRSENIQLRRLLNKTLSTLRRIRRGD